jgi:hypothetical protein
MDYAELQATAIELIREAGKPATFFRNGAKVTATSVVELESEQTDEPNSLLAQTAQTRKTYVAAPTAKAIQNGDSAVIEKNTYTVTKVSEFRPGTKTLYVTLEVV